MSSPDSSVVLRVTRPDPVDDSCRWPILALGFGALKWLLAGLLFSFISRVLMLQPAWACSSVFGPGKTAALSRVMLVYGFALPSAIALGFWVLFRAGGVVLKGGLLVVAGTVLWNIGVVFGVLGILNGEMTGIRGLDLPFSAAAIVLVAYVLIGLAVLPSYGLNRQNSMDLPQMLVLAGFLWFPWLMGTALVVLGGYPGRGVVTPISGAWLSQGILWGVLAPITLAVLIRLRTELLGRQLPRPTYAVFGFWALLFLAGWQGARTLIGGPVPAWITSAGVVSGVLFIIPTVLLGLNLFGGAKNGSPGGHAGTGLASLASIGFVIAGVLISLTSLRCGQRILQFTQFGIGIEEMVFLGFITLGLLAGWYWVWPRVVGFVWDQPLISAGHLALTVLGLVLIIGSSLVGGWLQGYRLDQATTDLVTTNSKLLPMLYLHSLGLLTFLGGQALFVLHASVLPLRYFPTVKAWALKWIQDESDSSAPTAVVRSGK